VTTPEFVVDTSALAAIVLNEPGAAKALAHLEDGGCVMHEVNVSELCFTLPRKRPIDFSPATVRVLIERLTIRVMGGFSPDMGRLVADIRLENQALNLGDGVAVALAHHMGIPVLTADNAFAKSSMYANVELIR